MLRYLLVVLLIEFSFPFAYSIQADQPDNFIHPGAVWPDDRGLHIQAHGGGIIHFGSEWFWFGEDRTQTDDKVRHFISCYSSSDLVHWKFCSRWRGEHWSITAVATSSSPPILPAGPPIQTSMRQLQNWRGLGPNLKTSLIRRRTPTDHNRLFSSR